jgi:hypothetical protein
MSQSNAAIIRKAYQDFATGNITAVFAAFSPAIRWHVPGHSPLSGDYTDMTRSEASFSAPSSCLGVSLPSRCTASWPRATSSSSWQR